MAVRNSPLSKSPEYAVLLNKVRKTLVEGQQRIEQERVRTYWETGKVIHIDILKHKDRFLLTRLVGVVQTKIKMKC